MFSLLQTKAQELRDEAWGYMVECARKFHVGRQQFKYMQSAVKLTVMNPSENVRVRKSPSKYPYFTWIINYLSIFLNSALLSVWSTIRVSITTMTSTLNVFWKSQMPRANQRSLCVKRIFVVENCSKVHRIATTCGRCTDVSMVRCNIHISIQSQALLFSIKAVLCDI